MRYSRFDRTLQIITIASFVVAIWSLWLSQRAFDIANTELENVKIELGAFKNKMILLKTGSCERIWFDSENQYASCYNGTKWDTCVQEFHEPYGCDSKDWFKEVRQTYSWNKTNGTW